MRERKLLKTHVTKNKIKCYPMFVKPSKAGSSVGITKVFNREELFEGIKKEAVSK